MLERFNSSAKEWDKKPMRVEVATQFVNGILSNIDKDISNFDLLDYGCGSGLVSFSFKDKVKSITGMDYSKGMIDTFCEKFKSSGYENISSRLHNINQDNISSESFDLIVTNMTMHHIKDTAMFINKLSSGLKKNGYICIADLESEDGTFHSDNDGVEHFGFDKEHIKSLYKSAGLDNIVVETLHNIKKENGEFPIFIAVAQKLK